MNTVSSSACSSIAGGLAIPVSSDAERGEFLAGVHVGVLSPAAGTAGRTLPSPTLLILSCRGPIVRQQDPGPRRCRRFHKDVPRNCVMRLRGHVLSCRGQVFPDCRGADITSVVHAARAHGLLAVRLIAGHGAGGGQRGFRDAIDVLGPCAVRSRTLGTSSRTAGDAGPGSPGGPPPPGRRENVMARSPSWGSVCRDVEDVTAQNVCALSQRQVSDVGGKGERTQCRRSARSPGA